jgi:hypothetical protein
MLCSIMAKFNGVWMELEKYAKLGTAGAVSLTTLKRLKMEGNDILCVLSVSAKLRCLLCCIVHCHPASYPG